MAISLQDFDFSTLSRDERMLLIEGLEQSLLPADEPDIFTDDQVAEINRRMDEADAGNIAGEPWQPVMDRLRRE